MVNYKKLFVYTVSGCCGIIGFALAYVLLGWLLKPIENFLDNKIK